MQKAEIYPSKCQNWMQARIQHHIANINNKVF